MKLLLMLVKSEVKPLPLYEREVTPHGFDLFNIK